MSMLSRLATTGGAADKTYIEDVFSTYLYTGNFNYLTINNGINLAGKGGMVWTKSRTNSATAARNNHFLIDSARGWSGNTGKYINSNTTAAESVTEVSFMDPTATGYTLGQANYGNENALPYVSWTFRKAPKFFDVVTYTGNDAASRDIAHSLGQAPGMVIVKNVTTGNIRWFVWHRDGTQNFGWAAALNLTDAYAAIAGGGIQIWNSSGAPNMTANTFSVGAHINAGSQTYVAYLFAHDTTTDGLIQCGSYTSNATTPPEINLGWEPQFILIKNVTMSGDDWQIIDNMRGMPVSGGNASRLFPNQSYAEITQTTVGVGPTTTGFKIIGTSATVNDSTGRTHIYMAIRRGPMRTPTDATKVFSPIIYTGNGTAGRAIATGILTDMAIYTARSSKSAGYDANNRINDRLRSINYLSTNLTDSEASSFEGIQSFDSMNAVTMNNQDNLNAVPYALWAFRRAPGFFDVVCYTNPSTNTWLNHNLGVVPELAIRKTRSATGNWEVAAVNPNNKTQFFTGQSAGSSFALNLTNGWGTTSYPTSSYLTDTQFKTTTWWNNPATGTTCVVYLFASCPGVSKVGSYVGNGTSQNINCGFTNGARFVLIKQATNVDPLNNPPANANWFVFDTARGIVAGNDPYLRLNTTEAENNFGATDTIDPYSAGFAVNNDLGGINANGETFIYLAIA